MVCVRAGGVGGAGERIAADTAPRYVPVRVRFGLGRVWAPPRPRRCPNNSYYQFIPVMMGTVFPGASGGASWNASCYQQTSAVLTLNGSTGGVVTFTVGAPAGLCGDVYMLV